MTAAASVAASGADHCPVRLRRREQVVIRNLVTTVRQSRVRVRRFELGVAPFQVRPPVVHCVWVEAWQRET